jgi:hypothetical protein
MDRPFDPYLKWLGIPLKLQPPNDYRLLGIEPFESDPDVISNAADQRMGHLKNFAVGQHSQLSQKILNEIAAARIRLLNPQAKAKYDAALRNQLQEQPPTIGKTATAELPVAGAQPQVIISVDKGETRGFWARRRPWAAPAVISVGLAGAGLLLALLFVGDGGLLNSKQTDRPVDQATALAGADSEPNQQQPQPDQQGSQPDEQQPPPGEQEPQPDEQQPPPGEQEPQPDEQQPPPGEQEPQPDEPDRQEPVAESEPTVPVETKLPGPDDKTKSEKAKQIREELMADEFQSAKTPQQKLALASQLAQIGFETADDPAGRFVLYQIACDLAAEAGDFDRAAQFVDQLGRWYEFNALAMKAALLGKIAKSSGGGSATRDSLRKILNAALELSDKTLEARDLELSGRCLRIANSAAVKYKDSQATASVARRLAELEDLKRELPLVQKALDLLEEDPADPEQNLLAGRWYCFVVGNWEKGLPHLAKGSDPTLADLAKRDLALQDPARRGMATSQDDKRKLALQQVEVADAWEKLGNQERASAQLRILSQVAYWDNLAEPFLLGMTKIEVRARIQRHSLSQSEKGPMPEYALEFDGQQSHVVVDAAFKYDGTSPITLEAIVRPAALYKNGTVIGNLPYANRIPFSQSAGLELCMHSRRWCFKFYELYRLSPRAANPRTRCLNLGLNSNQRLAGGQWFHLAGVFDGRKVWLYVDGQLRQSQAISAQGVHKASILPFVIGAAPAFPSPRRAGNALPNGPGRPPTGRQVHNVFAGAITAVRNTDTARKAQEVQPPSQLASDKSTRLLLFFDQGNGDVVQDSSGNRIAVRTRKRKRYETVSAKIMGAKWIKLDSSD